MNKIQNYEMKVQMIIKYRKAERAKVAQLLRDATELWAISNPCAATDYKTVAPYVSV